MRFELARLIWDRPANDHAAWALRPVCGFCLKSGGYRRAKRALGMDLLPFSVPGRAYPESQKHIIRSSCAVDSQSNRHRNSCLDLHSVE